jgi:hypothetical protein
MLRYLIWNAYIFGLAQAYQMNCFVTVSPNVSSGNAMIALGLSFRCGFALELIALSY